MTSPRLFYSSSEDPLSVFSLPWWPVTVVLSHATGAKVKFSLLCFFFLLRLFVLGVLSHPLHAWAPFLFALFRSSLLCSFILFLLFFLFYLLCCRCQHRRICGRTRLCFYVCSCVCVCVCSCRFAPLRVIRLPNNDEKCHCSKATATKKRKIEGKI